MKKLWLILLLLSLVYLLILFRNGIYIGIGTWDLNKEGTFNLSYLSAILSKLSWLIIPAFFYWLMEYFGKRFTPPISIIHILIILGVIILEFLNQSPLDTFKTWLIIGSLLAFGLNIFAAYNIFSLKK